MAGFGGTIKLQGEQAYRTALKAIAADLKNVAAEQKLTASTYDKTDTSLSALTKRSEDLKAKLDSQKAKWETLSKALKDYQSQQDKNKSTIQTIQAQLDKEKAKLEEVAKQYGTSSKEYQAQAKVVDELEQQLKELNAQYDKNEVTLKQTRAALTSTEADMRKTGSEMQKLGNQAQKAGDDTGQLGESAKEAARKAQEAAKGGFTVMKGILADLSARVIASAVEGVKRLGSAFIDVGKQSLASYGEYEQLVGGVETLFKDSAKVVQDYAAVAYKTAGMSANEYMSTVTSFSASLLQGLGGDTAKAARIADMAILDMSDNANKMGTSIESIQYAYQGFAKQNYTMLDNLKLGFGGSASEMARLINQTGVMGKAFKATAKNVKDVPFDKLIEAIHKVQQNMGITGTTALEASKTIQGSVGSMKSAWNNLLTAIADNNADLGKSIDEFVNSAITAGQNVVPRVRKIIDGVKKLIENLIYEVFPKLKKEVPELTPIIEPFEWIIKNYRLVVTGIGAIVSAFVASKVATFASQIVGLVQNFHQAATAAGGLAKAISAMNFAQMANPIGLVVGAIAGIGTAIFGVINNMAQASKEADEFSRELKEQTEAINDNKASWEELTKASQEQLNADMTQLTHVEALKDELYGLVDANGKVQKGYEGRVGFILGQLNEALGTEYKMTDGVIQKYGELTKSIDQIIEKKKAEAILNSQQAKYEEAITKQRDAYLELEKIYTQYTDKKAERQKIEETYNKLLEHGVDLNHDMMIALREKMHSLDEETSNLEGNYQTQLGLLDEYAYNIGTYEKNMALAHEGRYDEMSTATWDYVKDMKKAGDAEKGQLEQNIKSSDIQLKHLEQLYKATGNDIYKTQIENAKKQKSANEQNLKAYNQSTANELKNNGKTWLENSATVLSKLSDKKIEFRKTGKDEVQMFAEGEALGKPMATKEAEKIVKDTLKKFDKKAEAEGAGKNVITGFTKGEGNLSLQNTAFATARSFASNILSTLKNKLGIKSPSKETQKMGVFLLQGLGLGIEKEENSVLKQARDFGQSILGAMNAGLSAGVDTTALTDLQTALPSELSTNITTNTSDLARASQINEESIIGAFKTALSQMKIEMDDQEMGSFIDKTVSRRIFS